MFFGNLSIKTKIFSGFALLTAFLVIVGIVGITGSRDITSSFDDLVTVSVPSVRALLEMKSLSGNIELTLLRFEQESASTSPTALQDFKNELLAQFEKMDGWKKAYPVKDELGEITELEESVVSTALDIATMSERGAEAELLLERESLLREKRQELGTAIQRALDKEIKRTTEAQRRTRDVSKNIQKIITMVTLTVFAFALLIAVFTSRSVYVPLERLGMVVEQYTRGKFDERVPVTTTDEFGTLAKNFNSMADSLHSTYGQLEKELAEVERMNKFMVNREVRMAELKKEIASLRGEEKKEAEKIDTTQPNNTPI